MFHHHASVCNSHTSVAHTIEHRIDSCLLEESYYNYQRYHDYQPLISSKNKKKIRNFPIKDARCAFLHWRSNHNMWQRRALCILRSESNQKRSEAEIKGNKTQSFRYFMSLRGPFKMEMRNKVVGCHKYQQNDVELFFWFVKSTNSLSNHQLTHIKAKKGRIMA